MWAKSDHWPLEDAIRLSLELLPQLFSCPVDTKTTRRLSVMLEIARNCAGDSLTIINAEDSPDNYRVRPADFLLWAERKDYPIPEPLQKALDKEEQTTSHQSPSRFRPSQRHRERARALAALFWEQEPTLTIKAITERYEILMHACEGKSYGFNTLRMWMKDLCPNPRPGRRPAAEKTPVHP